MLHLHDLYCYRRCSKFLSDPWSSAWHRRCIEWRNHQRDIKFISNTSYCHSNSYNNWIFKRWNGCFIPISLKNLNKNRQETNLVIAGAIQFVHYNQLSKVADVFWRFNSCLYIQDILKAIPDNVHDPMSLRVLFPFVFLSLMYACFALPFRQRCFESPCLVTIIHVDFKTGIFDRKIKTSRHCLEAFVCSAANAAYALKGSVPTICL